MAKVSAVQRNNKRKKLTKRFEAKRAALKAVIYNKDVSPEERFQATLALSDLPKNSSKIRIKNRCAMTGRPRAYYRKFDLSRIMVRELGSHGEIPGLVKSSW
jgi:small subunit ribosomal protein S14